MASAGSAYLRIMPTFEGGAKEIAKQLKGKEAGETAGKEAGGAFHEMWTGAMRKIGEAAITGLANVAKGAVALGKQVVEQFAQYEQNIGGISTMFGDGTDTLTASAQKMVDYAQAAYKTAGLSANDYMANVTSFSAALIAGLGGDQAKAADVANKAMIDMSDNANKMGSDIGSIQNAYQGFAKQNYTMLDNLKLGYGGTKGEMQRLLKDAEKMPQAMGRKFDLSNYADVIEAIHVVQENMGIAGTTSKEAAETISGSIGMLKGAWTNLLTGMGTAGADVTSLVKNVGESVGYVIKNVGPVLENLAASLPLVFRELGAQLGTIMPQIGQTISSVLVGVSNAIGEMASSLAPLVDQILATLLRILPQLAPIALNIILTLATSLLGQLPALVDAGLQIVTGLASVLSNSAPQLITAMSTAVSGILTAIVNNLPQLLAAGVQLVQSLAQGLSNTIPALIPVAIAAVLDIAKTLIDSAPMLLTAALELITALADGLIQAIPVIVAALPDLITSITVFLISAIPDLITAGVQLIGSLLDAIPLVIPPLVAAIPMIVIAIGKALVSDAPHLMESFTKLWDAVQATLDKSVAAIVDTVMGVWNTMTGKVATFGEDVRQVFANAWNTMKTDVVNAFNAIKNAVTDKSNEIKNNLTKDLNLVKTNFTNDLNAVKQIFVNAFNNVKNTVVEFGNNIKTNVGNAINGLKQAVIDGFNAVVSFVASIPAKIVAALGDLYGLLKTSGAKIMDGLRDGITAGIARVTGAMSGALAKVREYLPFSPAKIGAFSGKGWTTYSGESIMTGLAEGITKGGKAAVAAAADTMEDISEKLNMVIKDSLAPKVQGTLKKYLTGAFADGLLKSSDDVVSVFANFGNMLEDQYGKIDDKIAKAAEKVEKASDKWHEALKAKKPKAATIAAAKEALDAAKDELESAKGLGDVIQHAASVTQQILDDQGKQLLDLQGQYEILIDVIAAARKDLDALMAEHLELANSFANAFNQMPSLNITPSLDKEQAATKALTDAQEKQAAAQLAVNNLKFENTAKNPEELYKQEQDHAEKLAKLNKDLADATTNVTKCENELAEARKYSGVDGWMQQLYDQRKASEEMGETLQALWERGLNPDIYNKLMSAGVEGLPFAQGVLALSEEMFSKLNWRWKKLQEVSGEEGVKLSDLEYLTGITASKNLLEGLGENKTDLEDQMGEQATAIINSLCEALGFKGSNFSAVFQSVGENTVEGLIQGFINKQQSANDKAKNVGDEVATSARKALGIKSPSTIFAEIGKDTIDGLIKGVDDKITPAKTKIGSLAEKVIGKAKEVFDITGDESAAFKGIGENVGDGLIAGLQSKLAEIQSVAELIAATVAQAMAAKLEIKSPSRLMRRYGGFVGAGLIEGMDDELGGVAAAAGRIAGTIATTIISAPVGAQAAAPALRGSAFVERLAEQNNNRQIIINNDIKYPQAEPTSLTVNRTLQHAAMLGI